MSTNNVLTLLQRPRPPAELISISGMMAAQDAFLPAPELRNWIHAAYLDENGPLYTPIHQHLNSARIECLWTNAPNARGGRSIVGQAEMPARSKSPRWQKARAEQQLREWFGVIPDFLITIDALYADDCDDRSFCCLIEHELRHCAQAEDEFGMPRFNKETGEPVFTLKAHDLEAFVADAARYGVDAIGDDAVNFVLAAASRRQISDTQIAIACGRAIPRKVEAA